MRVVFRLDGLDVSIDVNPAARLLDVLRNDLGKTGTKEGCGEGECGACAVLVDGMLMNACITPAAAADGRSILTIDGFRRTERFAVLSAAFEEEGSVQCGFCTPGFVMAAEALLSANPHPDERAVRDAISGNLCRCTGYGMIVRGILRAAEAGRGLW